MRVDGVLVCASDALFFVTHMARGVTDRLLHRHRKRHTVRAIDRASERRRSARVPVVRGGNGNGDHARDAW